MVDMIVAKKDRKFNYINVSKCNNETVHVAWYSSFVVQLAEQCRAIATK